MPCAACSSLMDAERECCRPAGVDKPQPDQPGQHRRRATGGDLLRMGQPGVVAEQASAADVHALPSAYLHALVASDLSAVVAQAHRWAIYMHETTFKQLDHMMLGITFFCSRPGPPVPQLLREGISESQAKSLVDSYTPMVNRGLGGCCTCKRSLAAVRSVWRVDDADGARCWEMQRSADCRGKVVI